MYETYQKVCEQGYSFLGRTLKAPSSSAWEWQYSAAYPPCYEAQGRFRFLRTLEIAKSFKAKRILEIAAGGGFNAICLLEDTNQITINDLLPLPDDFKCFKDWEKIQFIQKNLFELDSQVVGHFDLVICCEVIEHIAHGDEFVQKMVSLLAPKGHLLLTTPNGKYFRSSLPTFSQVTDFKALEEFQFKPDSDGHLYLYTGKELSDLFQKCGLKTKQIDFSITPFLSGHCKLRALPRIKVLFPFYFFVDLMLKKIAPEYFCTQMICTAEK